MEDAMQDFFSFDLNPGGVPARVYTGVNLNSAGAFQRPVILFYHGFASESAANTKEYASLVNCGFTVVAMDNPGHGRRRHADFDSRYGPGQSEFDRAFLGDLLQSRKELSGVLDDLVSHGARPFFGVTGISMGGFISYGAPLADSRVAVAAPILGNPVWSQEEALSPHFAVNSYPAVALLAQNGGSDTSVPPQGARDFHRELTGRSDWKGKSAFLEFAGEGHFFSEASWNSLWSNVTQWFVSHLQF